MTKTEMADLEKKLEEEKKRVEFEKKLERGFYRWGDGYGLYLCGKLVAQLTLVFGLPLIGGMIGYQALTGDFPTKPLKEKEIPKVEYLHPVETPTSCVSDIHLEHSGLAPVIYCKDDKSRELTCVLHKTKDPSKDTFACYTLADKLKTE